MTRLQLDNNNLNNNQVNIINDNNTWEIINKLKWYWVAKESPIPTETMGDNILQEYPTLNEISKIKNFVVEKREKLQNLLNGYYMASPQYFKRQWNLDNDSLFDFCGHIVGLGEVMYQYVSDHPEAVLMLQNDYTRSFEYAFDVAIWKFSDIPHVN